MNLQERLQALIGHDVMVSGLNDHHDEEGVPIPGVVPGTLREVGVDYLIIETQSKEDGGLVEGNAAEWQVPIQVEAPDAEQLVPIQYLTSVLHIFRGCAGCAVDSVSTKLKAQGG